MSHYSPSRSQLAQVSPDGRLLVWDSISGALKQQFAPAAHLSAAVSCAKWKPSTQDGSNEKEDKAGKKARKRRSSVSLTNGHGADEATNNDLVALGTVSGAILIYSTQFGDVKKTQENAHGKRVNDVVWTSSGSEVYSCSSDGFIGLFHARKSSFTKFRVGDDSRKHKFFSLCLHPSESSLIVGAAASIIWLDLDTKLTLRTFGGHVGEVASLTLFVGPSGPAVISHGANEKDHSLSVWNLEEDSEEKEVLQPAATLNANEAVLAVTAVAREDFVLVGCVSTSGVFHAFEYDPASKRKKNKALRPKASVQVATEKDPNSGKVRSIPVLASAFSQEDSKVRVAHGSLAKPVFESLDYDSMDKLTCLVRGENEGKEKETISADGCKYMVPDSTTGISVVGPSMGTPKTNGTGANIATSGTKRRISESGKVDELPMLERLRLLSKDTEHVTTPPRTDSLLQLLIQGLHNQDSKILNSVLDRADDELIDTTVRKLPVEGVVPLVQELQKFIKGRGMVGHSHAKWLLSVLQHHTAYLMSNPRCEAILASVHAMLESRTKHYQSLMQLKGKLDLITKQIQTKPEETSDASVNKEALLVYQDDSSDELSDVMDELLMPTSDAEDAWPMGDDDDDEDASEEDASEDDDEVEMVNGEDEEDEDEMESD